MALRSPWALQRGGQTCILHRARDQSGERRAGELTLGRVAAEVNAICRCGLNDAVEIGMNGDPHFAVGLFLGQVNGQGSSCWSQHVYGITAPLAAVE